MNIINQLKNDEKKKKIIKIAIDSPAAAGAGTQAKLILDIIIYYILIPDVVKIYCKSKDFQSFKIQF